MSEQVKNYYEILGVPMNASDDEIGKAMRHFIQNAPNNDETLAILQACKTHLLNAENRKQYNRELLLAYPELLNNIVQAVEPQAAPQQNHNPVRQPRPQLQREQAKPEPQAMRPFFKILLSIIGLCVVAVMFSGNGKTSGAKLDEWGAQVSCEDAVSNMLKAPTTAKFDNWVRTPNGDGSFMVTGTVDSQNSFGAMLRSQFSCKVRDKGNGTSGTIVEYLR
ncbi:J domain-containing protein [Wielerella bovis]|uniref:J domain-containing protein n=1 Tax=Wielerella bovis TaxID=2917790 RepID=UPI0020191F85|nr:J domain-containing protein [Wielerella bovis]ULJ61041.1 hypothetical protein MIS44_04085 [Wielerella bovis]